MTWRAAGARLGAGLALLAATARTAVACPFCETALGESERWAQGFNASILFMMAMPFAVTGVVAAAIYRARRRAASEHAEGPPAA